MIQSQVLRKKESFTFSLCFSVKRKKNEKKAFLIFLEIEEKKCYND